MPSSKRLNSVTHSIAHHAASTLSYFHPTLGIACKEQGYKVATISLLDGLTEPLYLSEIKEIRLVTNEAKSTFERILESEGFHLPEVAHCKLVFSFLETTPSNWCTTCSASILDAKGKSYISTVDWLGNKIENT